jgi:hypothetical protein
MLYTLNIYIFKKVLNKGFRVGEERGEEIHNLRKLYRAGFWSSFQGQLEIFEGLYPME